MASKTGKVGFVGGMDIPLIRKFACGYEQGARAANADIKVFQNMTGTTGAAWNDPVRGGELAKNQIDQGADVVYRGGRRDRPRRLADGRRQQEALDRRRLQPELPASGLGADLDGQARRPRGLQCLHRLQDGKFTAGMQALGVKEEGVAPAIDDNNKALITPEMQRPSKKAEGRHHLRQHQGPRLHVGQFLPGVIRADENGRRAVAISPYALLCCSWWKPASEPGSPAIELVGIDKKFGAVHANKDINLTVAKGSIHGIIGENGAGKSTLDVDHLRLLSCRQRRDPRQRQSRRHPRQPGGDRRRHRHGASALHAGRQFHGAGKHHARRRRRRACWPRASRRRAPN